MKRNNYNSKNKGPRKTSGSTKSKSFDRKEEASVRDKVRSDKFNDPQWYLESPLMAKDVASLNFNYPVGFPNNIDVQTRPNGEFITPGVMNLYAAMGPGVSVGSNSGVDTAMKGLYAKIRSENSGAKNYDPADLMLYILAVGNAYAFYAYLTRLYGLARIYIQNNNYLGRNMLEACGVDPSGIISDLAHFRAYINNYALRLGVFWVPASMSIFKRWFWMFSNVYADEDTSKAQFYMYQPAYFHVYNEVSGGPGELDANQFCLKPDGTLASPLSISILEGFGNSLIDALQKSKDILTMSGDILKAYGRENCLSVALIPEEYAVVPVFSEEVLYQIHNTTIAGGTPINGPSAGSSIYANSWTSFNVTQDVSINGGAIIWSPFLKHGASLMNKRILDFWKADVTPEDVMVATRNIPFGRTTYVTSEDEMFTQIVTSGTEIIMAGALYQLSNQGVGTFTVFGVDDDIRSFNQILSTLWAELKLRSKVKYFNQHPFMYFAQYKQSGQSGWINPPSAAAEYGYGEMSNYVIVDFDTIRNMHNVAVMSEFDIPAIANVNRA